MATKKRTAKNASSKKAVRPKFRTFKVAPTPRPFMAFRVTDQTVYWAIIGLIVLALGMWVIYLQVKINEVYDQVDSNTYQLELLPEDTKHSKNTN
ncbi:hypothetical protein RAAC3_TM7C00001G0796 [Candidatus Saccharibacteria bacterium RAAC3_TM7_1]|nr:hypothetical protein RAAC3_TM7C00001G0796 [Candidatus Saccharibacteria bacterium RAAC3_TM7_1]HCZ28500.1 hypothetical protein [Candidatus Saccharibacteria bacterium]